MEDRRMRTDRQGAGTESGTRRHTGPNRRQARRRVRRGSAQQTAREDAPPPPEGAGALQSLMEDITCSICLDDLRNPVSIACGHTYCRSCITTHWSVPQPEGYLCPECRTHCPPYQLAPDYRLMNLIAKIQRVVQERSSTQDSLVSPDPGFPLQLVWTDGDGRLHLDLSVVSSCFTSQRLSCYPVCLLCIIGEKRRGKSFLMNYIMRALESQEKGEELSLGMEDQPLQGFQWRSGTDSTTRGIWMWSRPFILGNKEDKVAVYVLDTEGSLDIEGDRESSIKLSALSMLLSSHLIFNVANGLKETELDYMEMYLNMGEELTSNNLQYLDILVRDWHDENCGRDAARFYISQEIEKLQKRCSYPKVLWGLKNSHTRCFLLPHPGKGITRESQGRLQDMDVEFQESLRTYISDVVHGVCQRVKKDRTGELLTCAHLPSLLQEIVELFEQQKYGFSTPMEMFYAIKNQKTLESIKRELAEFLHNQPSHVLPSTMKTLVSDKLEQLFAKFSDSLLGPNPAHHAGLLQELEYHMKEEERRFCSGYTTRFTCNAIGLGLTAGIGIYGVVGAAAARGTVVLATEPAVVETVMSTGVATGTVALLKSGLSALFGRFLRGGL